MVRLKNLKKNNSFVECDFIPEDSGTSGHIIVDIRTGDISECVYPIGYEWCLNHANHVRSYLIESLDDEKQVEEKLIMWG